MVVTSVERPVVDIRIKGMHAFSSAPNGNNLDADIIHN